MNDVVKALTPGADVIVVGKVLEHDVDNDPSVVTVDFGNGAGSLLVDLDTVHVMSQALLDNGIDLKELVATHAAWHEVKADLHEDDPFHCTMEDTLAKHRHRQGANTNV